MANESSGGLALTIGTFDGVHRGHQLLLEKTGEIADERGIDSGAY
ncbi:adenylyltransferase/cytidyltransferase family protein, partial [Candidatus Bipolaricaulota bacterium]|nr:adenylyltransferase/cytidyltransferase family protein [Candidatus Bipolaricaulota bacterium]